MKDTIQPIKIVEIDMKDTIQPIKIVEIEEHEDGSATLKIECSSEVFGQIFSLGFVDLIKKGLAKVES